MVSCAVRQASRSAALLALAVLPVVCPAAASDEERERELLDRIQEIQSRDGQYSPALLEQLRGLILLYAESDNDSLAVVVIERALQVVRANSGLYSLEQVPLLWQRIASEEARGNDAEVWDLEQELLTLVRRHPNDVRAAQVLHEMADRQMAVLERVIEGRSIPPQVIYGCFYKTWPQSDSGSCQAGSRKDAVQGMLAEAQRNYADAIAILLRNEEYASAELRELEMELLRGADLIRTEYDDERRGITGTRIRTRSELPVPLVPRDFGVEHREPWRSRTAPVVALATWQLPYESAGAAPAEFVDGYETRDGRLRDPYHRGRQSLRRLYAYGAASSMPVVEQATAIVLLADWDLLFAHHGFALEGYDVARAMLERAGTAQNSIAELFAPPVPVVLPAFQPNPLAGAEARMATGHIDVAFTLTKYGRARDVELRGAANVSDGAREALEALIKTSRFRPRIVNGELAVESPVAFRYYLYD
jgi:hypothetical protein